MKQKLKKIYITLFCIFYSIYAKQAISHTIMLSPAGDAQSPGRIIDTVFERGLTLQFTQELKNYIENHAALIQVIISRNAGQPTTPLKTASFANQLAVDIFINISFYQEQTARPRLYLYQYKDGFSEIANWRPMTLYTYEYAHHANHTKTTHWSSILKNALINASDFKTYGPYCLPLQPLIGITSPAFIFELGLKQKNDWHAYIQPLGDALITLLEEHTS